MNRLASDDAGDFSGCGQDFDFESRQSHFVDSSDLAEGNQPLIRDVDDLETDFIVMAGEHHAEFGFRIQNGNGVACDIHANLVGKRFQTFPIDRRTRHLVSGRPGTSH